MATKSKAKKTETKTSDGLRVKAATKPEASEAEPETKPETAAKKPTKSTDNRTITVLAKENPHAAGSRRAGWFKLLKDGMTVAQAVELGVRSIYLQRMAARGIFKLG
jgi:hypothetical protein